MKKRIVFTGGGTAGHVLPARAIMERLADYPDVQTAWVGSHRGIERALVQSWGVDYYPVPSGKLRRYFSVYNFLDLFAIAAGIAASLALLARLRPNVLFSKGGYVSVPPVIAAWVLGIPVVTHESDLLPGLATRVNAHFARRILVAYDYTAALLRPRFGERVITTGNPVRAAVLSGDRQRGLRILGFSGRKPIVLFLGGSRGSQQINQLVRSLLPKLRSRCDIVHQRGDHPAPEADGRGYRSFSFAVEEYAHLLAAADTVVCRAGAGTLWEVAIAGKAAILLPLGTDASRGDQVDNARYFADRGAAVALFADEGSPERVLETIDALIEDRKRVDSMAAAARAMVAGDPAAAITGLIVSLCRE